MPGDLDDACIPATGTYTVTLSSGSTTGVNSLTLGGASVTQKLVIGSGMTFYGAIAINPTGVLTLGDGGNGDTRLTCIGTCVSSLNNAGLLKTVAGGGGNRNIDDDITNGAGATIDYGAGQSAQTGGFCGNTNRGLTNNGTVLIEPSSQLLVNCGSFVNQAGTLANQGSVWISASRFVQRGGSVSGNALVLSNGGVLDDDTSAAGGLFTFTGGPNPRAAHSIWEVRSRSRPSAHRRVSLSAAAGGLRHPGVLFCEEIATIDRDFLSRGPLGPPLSSQVLNAVVRAVRRALGDLILEL